MILPVEVEANIKHHKAIDTSDKRVGKGQKEEVLRWFVQKGTAYRQSVKTMRQLMNIETEKARTNIEI